jgi:uncharacterized protein YjlB
MPAIETFKKLLENVTGSGRPARVDLARLIRKRSPRTLTFADDGKTPNNPRFPLLLYKDVILFRKGLDPAAIFEAQFAKHNWKRSWRDGIYDFLHFHTSTHEVLGIAQGSARVRFGGSKGKTVKLERGDVVVIPAGTGHRRISSTPNLLVVGAYPANGKYDEPKPGELDHKRAIRLVTKVGPPPTDPIYGSKGPLHDLWTN